MKIFFVHEVDYLKKVIFEMHEFPELLSQVGHQVTFFDYPERTKKLFSFNRKNVRTIKGRSVQDVDIELITPFTISSGMAQRLLSPMATFLTLTKSILRIKPDIIVTYAVPTYGLQLIFLCKVLKIPLVYRAIDISHLIRATRLNGVVRKIENSIIARADLVSCNNTEMVKYCQKLRNSKLENVRLSYPPIQLSHFSAARNQNVTVKNIIFIGTLFPFCGLREFIQEFFDQKLNKEGYVVTIIGGGDEFDSLAALIERLELNLSVKLLGFKPYSELVEYLSIASIAINPFRKSLVTDTALPHKAIQYAAAGKLIISTPLEGLKSLFDVNDSIFWADGSVELVETLRKIALLSEDELLGHINAQDSVLQMKLDIDAVLKAFVGQLLGFLEKN
jgi:glycosyltransferase involved in cell wall biosynthesis